MKAAPLLLRALGLILFAALAVACGSVRRDVRERVPLPDPVKLSIARDVARGERVLALRLYQSLAKEEGNLLLAPQSIAEALSLLALGAEGETREEIRGLLGAETRGKDYDRARARLRAELINHAADHEISFLCANDLWPQKGAPLRKDFLWSADRYDAGIQALDYESSLEAARRSINAKVAGARAGRLAQLFGPGQLPTDTRLAITNALRFRADWDEAFEESATKPAPFFLTPEKAIQAPLMNGGGEWQACEDEDVQVVDVPYKGRRLAMMLVVPRAKDGLKSIEAGLSEERLAAWTAAMTRRDVNLALPRFTFDSAFDLSACLQSLGLSAPFGFEADFSRIKEDGEELRVGAWRQMAFIRVAEEGTEAAASTGLSLWAMSAMPAGPISIRADRPFLFLIRDTQSGEVLFIGRVARP